MKNLDMECLYRAIKKCKIPTFVIFTRARKGKKSVII